MKHRLFLIGVFSLFSLFTSLPLFAIEVTEQQTSSEQKQPQLSALYYLENMKQAYKKLNYELLYLNSAQSLIEPKQIIHGVQDGKRITYFRFLNGAMRESLQFDGKISFYEQGIQAYSLATERDRSVFANIANFNFEKSSKSYEYIILGKGRIAAKKAIAIRMISKDEYRYSYIIWLDLDSFLPLRLDTINKSNVILEQTMVVSLIVTEKVNPWIEQLSHQKTPQVLDIPKVALEQLAQWQIGWLPEGFHIVKDDQHKLMMHDTDPVSYIMLNDGIVTISVYISTVKIAIAEQQKIIQQGGRLLYTKQQGNVEINIIGETPLATAEKIAASIRPAS